MKITQKTNSNAFPARFKSVRIYRRVVHTRAEWEGKNGKTFQELSASGIPPLWFDKREGKTAEDNGRDLLVSLRAAADAYQAEGSASPWDLHCAVTPAVREQLRARDIVPLAAGFGPAMLEAALVDGVCRTNALCFSRALTTGVLGVPAEILRAVPETPLDSVALRHTVGLADTLSAADLADPAHDGLPETLEAVVAHYRPRYFKVKISGSIEETVPRLRRIAEILEHAGDYAVTLDGNEQFPHMDAFADFLEVLRRDSALENFLSRILWIEQPVQRGAALDPASAAALARVSAFRPVILDESDGEEDTLERGLALGYAGVSSKTCKGLFRAVTYAARLREAREAREARGGRALLIHSCEDLTTVPVHPLQQDLCLAAALGLRHAERNGHHYVLPGSFLSGPEARDALREAPSLYETGADGRVRVRVTDGGFHLGEVNAASGFGSAAWPDWEALQPSGPGTGKGEG